MLKRQQVSATELLLMVNGSLYGPAGVEFENALESIAGTSYETITIDLSKALGITSAAIGKILSVNKRLKEKNRTFRIHGCNEVLFKTFKAVKLDTLIEILQ
ncbi:MAG TPA: STAS domain-containing protein [Spirochaetia bacterium]